MVGHRPRRKPGENRQRLVEAGLVEFGLFGYHGASTAGIAARADVPQPHVYASFATKHELFLACVAAAAEELTLGDAEGGRADGGHADGGHADGGHADAGERGRTDAAAGERLDADAGVRSAEPDQSCSGARILLQAVAAAEALPAAPRAELRGLLAGLRDRLGAEGFDATLSAAARSLLA
ncbi:TetR/AcrR family transcriptional regulator [Leucobacter allii]|uniref:TetR/AcrR family transcriptional regulator n=1 Tax=Leucobacter allii TaxID=2932247 RepID=UPI001FD123CB|nr:TetR/AcrR family transcriptional regulator [Leucobacter allii]UOR03046.1 TetR/AcrR family transcriptional regulator [Leucobacter allii]